MDVKVKYDSNITKNSSLCVFASYHKDLLVEDFIYYYLKQLHDSKFDIVFVSNSKIDECDVNKLKKICKRIIEKENIGLDFTAYKAGLAIENYGRSYEKVLLTNVSVYGPLFSLDPIFEKMKNFDFWGLTENYEIAYHLQSYFLCFNQKVTNSDVWRNFWDNVKNIESKEQIIVDYEVGLSRELITSSLFNYSSYINYFDFIKSVKERYGQYYDNGYKTNLTLYYWDDIIIRHRFPFLKKTLIDKEKHWNEMGISIYNWEKVISKVSDYPLVAIIKE